MFAGVLALAACGSTGAAAPPIVPGSGSGSGADPRAPAACAVVEPDLLAAVIGSASRCSFWGCGTNSPTVGDGVVFDELDSRFNAPVGPNRIAIVEASRLTVPVTLRVDRQELVATELRGGRELRGTDLIDTIITLRGAGGTYELKINNVKDREMTFWANDPRDRTSGAGEFVPFYEILTRATAAGGFQPSICRPGISTVEKIWTGVDGFAIVFAGDHYDPVHKLVSDTPAGTTLFNLACAGAAPAKMHLMRHTNAGSWTADHHLDAGHAPFATSVAQRQAMLKMFAADYCGTGHAFTIDGQPLVYGDAAAWYPPTPTTPRIDPPTGYIGTIESLWDDHGALCLDTPRLVDSRTIQAACPDKPLLPCGGPHGVAHWEDRVHVISTNSDCPPVR